MNGIILRIIDTLILAIFGIIAFGPPNIPYLKPFNVKFELNLPFKGNLKSNIENERLYTDINENTKLETVFSCEYLDKKMIEMNADSKAYNVKKELPKKSNQKDITPSMPQNIQIIGSDKEEKEEKKRPTVMKGVTISGGSIR